MTFADGGDTRTTEFRNGEKVKSTYTYARTGKQETETYDIPKKTLWKLIDGSLVDIEKAEQDESKICGGITEE
jgi:hypothetical protein